ncbi:Tetratricopeptide repeat protein [Aquisphaera giovannonii]|uniref:Tetratricopeptide repeat protein n=1 Tax=Aquisphaera giovannonii TaxID=406548 RepID=A0A5B9W010_9BACT|nr:tetratricopeptide repeat protein [Aquisphaera giovannonii]QEH34006.1 Tetratricopeptide repeat protein [Aquisphaera giovannonii]
MSAESNPVDRQKAKTFFQYGNDAVQKSNLDYAIDMYKQACKLVPDSLPYRQSLRGAQRKKFNNDPTKVGMLAGAKNQTIRMRARSAKSKGQHLQALEVCEEAFTNNPWDVATAWEASEAAEGAKLGPLAEWYVESVLAFAKDVDFFRHAAAVFERNEHWAKAIATWERVKQLDPNDENANRKINQLSASSTIQRAGLDQSLDRRNKVEAESKEEAQARVERLKIEQLSPEERWLKEIQDNPNQVWPYMNLAEHHRNRSQLDHAEKILAQGVKNNPREPMILQAYADVQIARMKRAIDSWTQRVSERPDDEAARAKLEQITRLLADYEIKEHRRRLGLNPEDANLHYQLGLCLAKAGQHDEAIAEFQHARSSPALKVKALYQVGLSFEANRALKLADRAYRDALKNLEDEDLATSNALHYRLGRVAEEMGNMEAAEEHYNEVAANDYSYLDVAQRLRNLN